jgi:hypothetical protein
VIHTPSTDVREKQVVVWRKTVFVKPHVIDDDTLEFHISRDAHIDVEYDFHDVVVKDGVQVERSVLLAPTFMIIIGTRKRHHVNVKLVSTKPVDVLIEEYEERRKFWAKLTATVTCIVAIGVQRFCT